MYHPPLRNSWSAPKVKADSFSLHHTHSFCLCFYGEILLSFPVTHTALLVLLNLLPSTDSFSLPATHTAFAGAFIY